MSRKFFLIFTSLLLILTILPMHNSGLALSGDDNLLEEFQKRKDEIEVDIENFESEAKTKREEKKNVERTIEVIQEEISVLTGKIIKAENNLKKIEQDINRINQSINELTKEIEKREKELKVKSKEIEEQKEILGQSLSFMYENRELSIFDFIFGSEKLSEIINAFDFMNIITDENEKVYDKIVNEEKEIQKLKKKVETDKDLKELELIEQENLFNEQKEEEENLNSLLAEQELKEEEANEKLQEIIVDEEAIKAEIIKQMEEIENIIKENEKEVKRREEIQRKKEEEERRRREAEERAKEQGQEQEQGQSEVEEGSTGGNEAPSGNLIFRNPMVPGTYRFTSGYGMRYHPIFKVDRMHHGVDLAAPHGTPIYAAADGVVLFSGPAAGYGNWIVISHSNGYYTIYAHMSQGSLLVSPGQEVRAGQHIAGVGSSGNSTGPHLHFEIANGRTGTTFHTVNPVNFISF